MIQGSKLTTTVSVDIHPPAGLVTVNTYVPAFETVGVAVFAPDTINPLSIVFHEYGTLGVGEEPSSITCVSEQLKCLSSPAFAPGGVHDVNGANCISTPFKIFTSVPLHKAPRIFEWPE